MPLIRSGAMIVALLGSVSLAAAQTSPGAQPGMQGAQSGMQQSGQINLTQQQKQKIWQSLANASGQTSPSGFQAREGATVPQQVSLQPLPQTAASDLPQNAQNMQFVKLNDRNEILLVNPSDRRVVEVITQSEASGGSMGTTGGTSGTSR